MFYRVSSVLFGVIAAVGAMSASHMVQKPLPKETTFLFGVFDIDWPVRYRRQETLPCRTDCWSQTNDEPPRQIWRWKNGNVTLEPNKLKLSSKPGDPNLYSCITMYLQRPSGDSFWVYPADVRKVDANGWKDGPGRWVDFGLNWIDPMEDEEHYYTEVRELGEKRTVAPNAESTWKQLFPDACQPRPNVNQRIKNEGLIGSIALILALVAFSCMPQNLQTVLEGHIGLRKWKEHFFDHGRLANRGIILAVWRDPEHTETNDKVLGEMERGKYGPIFAP